LKFIFWISTATFVISLNAYTLAKAASTREIYNVAKSVTVQIENKGSATANQGSGLLVNENGNLYTVITNKHVVECPSTNCTYTITTPDSHRHTVRFREIITAEDLDLALLKFSSENDYQTVKLTNSIPIKTGDIVYTAGFPDSTNDFRFAGGEVVANAKNRLIGDASGYTLIYNSHTEVGMSGSGVFNQDGKVVAIHGQGDRVSAGTMWISNLKGTHASSSNGSSEVNPVWEKSGFNRGIPTEWFFNSVLSKYIFTSSSFRTGEKKAAQSADDFFILGFHKLFYSNIDNIKNDKKEALQNFNRAIELNPNFNYAYENRSSVKFQLGDIEGAKADLTKAFQLDAGAKYGSKFLPENKLDTWSNNRSDFTQALRLMNEVYAQLSSLRVSNKSWESNTGDVAIYKSILQKLNKAIGLFPKDSSDYLVKHHLSSAYIIRGDFKKNFLNDISGATTDSELAEKISPNPYPQYVNTRKKKSKSDSSSINNIYP
jgi:tetratricopeptide (TPR) repeat protein